MRPTSKASTNMMGIMTQRLDVPQSSESEKEFDDYRDHEHGDEPPLYECSGEQDDGTAYGDLLSRKR